jgi:hypothetical protein
VKAAALKAYGAYWREKQVAYAQADAHGTRLAEYAVAEAWTSVEREITGLAKQGSVATGTPKQDPSVTELNTTGTVWAASVRDCLDISGWTLVEEESDQPVALEPWDGRWVVVKATQEDRAC